MFSTTVLLLLTTIAGDGPLPQPKVWTPRPTLWVDAGKPGGAVYGVGSPQLERDDGVIRVTLQGIDGYRQAVLHLPLEGLSLTTGKLYLVRMELSRDQEGEMIITYPEADWGKPRGESPQANSSWHWVGPRPGAATGEFVYDPGVNQGRLGLWFSVHQVGRTFTISRLTIAEAP